MIHRTDNIEMIAMQARSARAFATQAADALEQARRMAHGDVELQELAAAAITALSDAYQRPVRTFRPRRG